MKSNQLKILNIHLLKDKIFYQTLQGDDKTRDKIIKNISKEVTIEKQGILIEN